MKRLSALLVILLFLGACTKGGDDPGRIAKVDDWQYKTEEVQDYRNLNSGGYVQKQYSVGAPAGAPFDSVSMAESFSDSGNIGFSVGGAKDINNFRENIENGYLPISSDITYEGIFYDYFFDTGEREPCKKLFCASYTKAVSADPLSKQDEYFLAVGLNSGIKESDFQRKKLNLVVVLDVSGSMSSSFDKYYYDRFGRKVELEEKELSSKSKMEVATKSIVALLDHLTDDDQLGIVLFDDSAYLAKPISRVGDTDMKAIKDHVLELNPKGGTNMSAGIAEATNILKEYASANKAEYENRIIFLTDAMPNRGDYSDKGLLGMTKSNAENGIYSTFIGIGVDFNSDLVETITKIRGANYYSVHSEKEFSERMDEGFDYMVTPLVFDLKLTLAAPGYEILKVYGSPEANEATGEIMKVNTLFPSKKVEEETRGGIVILHLKKKSEDENMNLTVSYQDREGKLEQDQKTLNFSSEDAEFFENKGIRKGILLARYVNLMKDWVIDERKEKIIQPVDYFKPTVSYESGIIIPEPPISLPMLNEWERQSVKLSVSSHYARIFKDFAVYFAAEMKASDDETLKKESDILNKLAAYLPGPAEEL